MTTRMTKEEWMARGIELFGPDTMKWKFVCPVCKHVQSTADFHKYRDAGATPSSAHRECIGRYIKGSRSAFSDGNGDGPCTYTGCGLFQLSPICVVTDDGDELLVFDFAVESPNVALGNHQTPKVTSEVVAP